MTKNEVINKIKSVALANGFNVSTSEYAKMTINISAENVIFLIEDEEELLLDEKSIQHSVTLSAAVSRMGGWMKPDELLEISREIKAAAEMVNELNKMNLGYKEHFE